MSAKTSLWILCSVLLLGPSAAGHPQDAAQVSVRLSNPLVKLGGETTLEITVQGTRDAEVVAVPEVPGLLISRLVGPQSTEIMETYGGRVHRRTTLDWTLDIRPTKAGEFQVPPITLRVDGEERRVPSEPLALRVIEDLKGAEHCFIEAVRIPERVFEGQPFELDLRFGTDLSAGEVDLYLPWWPAHRGVLELKDPNRRGNYRFRVNDRSEVMVGELPAEERNGVKVRVFQLARRYIATRPGRLEFDVATFQFSEVLRRATVFSSGRYKRYYAQSEPFVIEVLPVPEESRPLEWTGAVGQFVAQRRVARRDVDEGSSLPLTVFWSGDGNLEFFTPPDLKRLDSFADFRVLGVEDAQFDDERRVTYDLMPTSSDITEIPPVPLWVFDPSSERYELIETEPVAVRVRAVADEFGTVNDWEDGIDIRDLHTRQMSAEGLPEIGNRPLAWSGAAVIACWLVARTLVRRRRGDPDAPLARRRRRALRTFESELSRASTSSAQSAALAHFLAARTREPDSAWVGRDLQQWCAEAEAPLSMGDALQSLARVFAELDEAAWAKEDQPLGRGRLRTLVRSLIKEGF